MLYERLATAQQVSEYMAVPVEELPSDIDRVILRASERIMQMVKSNYDSLNTEHVEAVQLATCAQVEYMLTLGEALLVNPQFESFSIGKTSMSLAKGSRGSGVVQMGQRALGYLNDQGLLYRGIKM